MVVIRRKRKANDIVGDSNDSRAKAKATPEPWPASNPSHAIVTNDNHASSHHERPESELSNVTPHHDHQEYESHDGCPENDGWIVCVTPPDVWTDAQPRYPLVNRLEVP